MAINQFIDKFLPTQGYSANTEKQYRYRLLALCRYEEEINIPVYEFNQKQMIDALRHISSSDIIWASIKNILMVYFDWLEEQGTDVSKGKKSLTSINIDKLSASETNGYFYTIDHLLAKIAVDVEWVSKLDAREPEDYRMVVSALLLSWYGLDVKSIVEFRKFSISTRNNAILINGEWIKVPDKIIELLYECSTAVGYNKNGGFTTAFVKYQDSEFLIRTHEKDNIGTTAMSAMVSEFNKKLLPGFEPYSFGRVFKSGVFARAYIKESERGGEPPLPSLEDKQRYYGELFCENLIEVTLYKRIKEYKTYKSKIK